MHFGALNFQLNSNVRDFFKCCPAKYMVLHQNTEITLFLPYVGHKDKRSAFEIWQSFEHHLVSLGARICALPQ